MTAFAQAINTLFGNANLGVDGLWRAGGIGAGVAVRIIRRSPDRVAPFGDGRFVTDTHLLDVRTSEVAVLAIGDTFQIGSEIYTVQSEPLRDGERLVWAAEVRLL